MHNSVSTNDIYNLNFRLLKSKFDANSNFNKNANNLVRRAIYGATVTATREQR